MDVEEEVVSGFCKAQNQTRMVICEFENREGGRVLTGTDCAYGACPHSKDCVLMRDLSTCPRVLDRI